MIESIEVTQEFIDSVEDLRRPENTEDGFIEACSKNVNLFAEKQLGVRPYAWQAYVLHKAQKALEGDAVLTNREFIWLTSRQVGKSVGIAILAVWAAIYNKAPGGINFTTDIGVVSASDVQAKKLLYEMKKLLRRGDTYMEDTYLDEDGKPLFGGRDKDGNGFFSRLLDPKAHNNTTTITFLPYDEEVHGPYILVGSKAGNVIRSYPPSASVLGETFSIVIIDEAGKTDRIDDVFFYDYIYPTGNERNALRIYTSTPWVQSGFFFEMCHDESHPADITLFTIEAIKLENTNYYSTVMKIVDQMHKDGKIDEVRRAYYCEFVKGEASYFKPEKVRELFTEEDTYPLLTPELPVDMGVDFGGQVKSRSVITLSYYDPSDGHVYRMYHKTYEVQKDLNLLEDIQELLTLYNVQRIIPDECPQGDFLIRQMREKGWNVHPMNFRKEKVKKFGAFRSALYRGEVHSYEDPEMLKEMLALENSQTSTQSKIIAPTGYTDDLVDSFVLSTYFMIQEEGSFNFYNWSDIKDIEEW